MNHFDQNLFLKLSRVLVSEFKNINPIMKWFINKGKSSAVNIIRRSKAMMKFIKFVESNSSEKLRKISLIMLVYILISPVISRSNIDILVLLNGLIFIFSCIGYMVFAIKEYIRYTKAQKDAR